MRLSEDELNQFLENNPELSVEGMPRPRGASQKRKRAGKQAQRRGADAERAALQELAVRGVCMLHSMPTPYALTGKRTIDGKAYFQVRRKAKVQGDINGILPGGRRVLAEVKSYKTADNLQRSMLKEHQVQALLDNQSYGGVSLIVWVTDAATYVINADDAGRLGLFEKGGSITPEQAAEVDWWP